MESGITIFYQIIKMFVMMAVGYVLYKKNTINDDTTARLSNILLMVATPCTLITSFNQTYSDEKFQGLMISFALSAAVYIFAIIVAKMLFKKEQRIEIFSVVFSNAGFLGIPLVTGLFDIQAVFYLSPFIVCFYLFAWTFGVVEMSGKKELVTMKKISTNPCILCVFVGIVVFFLPAKPFAPLMEAVATLGSLNTPLAMLILGAYMAKSSLLDMFKNKKAYLVSFHRLVLIPALLLVLFCFVPEQYNQIKTIILVAASAPVGVLAPVFAQMFHLDSNYGAQIVSLSTILCLLTMPVVLLISEMIW